MKGKRFLIVALFSLATIAVLIVIMNSSQHATNQELPNLGQAVPLAAPLPTNKEVPLVIVFGVFRPPYIFGKQNSGIDFDLAQKTMELAGYRIEALHSPNKRAFREIEMGKVDGVIGLSPLQDRPGIYFSAPLVLYDNVVVTKRVRKLAIRNTEDLRNIRFLAFSNARNYLGPAYADMVSKLKYDTDISNQEMQNRMFWQDKVDAIVLDLNVFRFFRGSLAAELDTSQEIDVHRIFSQQANERVAAFRDSKVRDDFNQALAELKASGEYQKVLDRYLHVKPLTPQ